MAIIKVKGNAVEKERTSYYKPLKEKVKKLKGEQYLEVIYSDVHDDDEDFSNSIKKIESEGYPVKWSFDYKGSPGIRGETIYNVRIYPIFKDGDN